MQPPPNHFKRRLLAGEPQIGLWAALADSYVIELLASVGFDWLLLDNEHAPNDLRSTLGQLQAMAPYASQPVVRPVIGETALLKQYLDIGAQNLLIPMVNSAEQARDLVSAVHYPPRGIRGIGSALARASRWNQVDGYLHKAGQDICLLVQVETLTGLSNLSEICAVDGVDGVFFGPGDLSASMGLIGQTEHPDVVKAIGDGIARVRKGGKAAGILAPNPARATEYLAQGANFVAVGSDTTLLVRAATDLLSKFRSTPAKGSPTPSAY